MRQTLLHFERIPEGDHRQALCSALEKEGGNCDATLHSTKPHLLFITYDETRLAPHDLVRIAANIGNRAQVVDL